MSKIDSVSISAAAVLVVAFICAAATYGCVNTNRQYYDALGLCVQAGGSALPTSSNGTGTLICIRGGAAHER